MRDPMPLLVAIFVLAIVAIAYASTRWELAVYALSFWHYLIYALAFLWRRITLERFKRDSFLLRTISLAALGFALWTTVPNTVSIVVILTGFALNVAAVWALGTDRTYYGYELAAIPGERITSFPYSITAHPMLIGNMLAFGGALLDGEFRELWWSLAILHVALNLGIILMEAYGGESRRSGSLAAIIGLGLGAILLLSGFWDTWPYTLATIVAGSVFGMTLIRRYA
ncbi:MAG: methyltransferase [Geminicoccaceae bacterium]